jgi:CheY-like chemotaxis protein
VAGALDAARARRFDVVVSDLGLPDGTGYELMRQLRDGHSIPGIALSGYGMEEDVQKCYEAGFVEHLVKPVQVAKLLRALDRVLERLGPS